MIPILKNNWERYKDLKTWKQVLWLLPLILLVILSIVFFFVKPKSDRDKYIDAVKTNKKHVDKQIELNKVEQIELKKLDEKLEKKQVEVKKEIEKNYEKAKEVNADINDAVSNNNVNKLKRIHAKLNNKSRRR